MSRRRQVAPYFSLAGFQPPIGLVRLHSTLERTGLIEEVVSADSESPGSVVNPFFGPQLSIDYMTLLPECAFLVGGFLWQHVHLVAEGARAVR